MSTMVERVARAIELAGWKYGSRRTEGRIPEMCEELARAAIEAMKEPTPEMKAAGSHESAVALGDSFLPEYEVGVIYQAMISAALSEKGGENE